MKILQFPLARITVCFILGILFFKQYQPAPITVFGSLLLCTCILVVLHFLIRKKRGLQLYFGIFTLLVSFLIGISTSIVHKETYNHNHYTNQIRDYETPHLTELIITEKLKSTPKNTRYVTKIKSLDGTASFGKIILTTGKSNHEPLAIGTMIKTTGIIYKNRNPFNPNQFDYGKYLENQEIYAQLNTYENRINIRETSTSIWSQFSNFRTKIIKNLEHSNIKSSELNILIALLLGQQQDISPEILKDYQYAGAVHILSVSGLHVGFILLIVTFFLKPVSNNKKGSLLKLFAVLLSLWTFGLLAGLAPSVVRSAAMFSIVAVGNHLRRTLNIFHTLLVSMMLILLFKPSYLFDIGFQLSYLALFFILWLQPLLSSVREPKNKILKYFWDIITVSFAAQIGTMPLSIYYFHQFPALFFITNLLVLPLLGVIMTFGIIAILMACFGQVPAIVVQPLEFLISLLNNIIHRVATFDDFVIKNISFTHEILLGSYLVIICIILWIEKPFFKRLAISLLCVLVLQSIYIFTKYNSENTIELLVFNTKKGGMITERKNNLVSVYSSDSILQTLDKNVAVQSYLADNSCNLNRKKNLKELLYFKNKKILIIDSSGTYLNIEPDILIIINSPKLNLERLFSQWKPQQIVVDGSNFKSYVRLWEATCRKEKIPFHNTGEKGFYKL